jgi:hypothetical protein
VDSPEERRTRQRNLIEMYAEFHRRGDKFGGDFLGNFIPEIEALIKHTGSKTVLDYGCGRARFYKEQNLAKRWGVGVGLYDPAVEDYKTRPEGKFDGVICTDVLEHVLDPQAVLAEIFGYAKKFVFLSISCLPSNSAKSLSDGTPFHISIHPPSWWRERIPKTDARVELRFDVEG